MMPYAPFNVALIDGRLGLAWAWYGQSRTFRRTDAELGLVNCWLRRTGGYPFQGWQPAANVHQAMASLAVASAADHQGVIQPRTDLRQWAMVLWRDGDRFGYVAGAHAVRRASLSVSADSLAFYAEDTHGASAVPRARTFAQTLDHLTDHYGRHHANRPALVS